jgi:hypothetical protein
VTEQTHGIFDIAAITASFPAAAETMLVDTRMTDEAAASSRVFRVYRQTSPHYHATCDEYLLKRNTVHAVPEILEGPVVVPAIDTPRRDPATSSSSNRLTARRQASSATAISDRLTCKADRPGGAA